MNDGVEVRSYSISETDVKEGRVALLSSLWIVFVFPNPRHDDKIRQPYDHQSENK